MAPHELVAQEVERVRHREVASLLVHEYDHRGEEVEISGLLARVRAIALVDGLDQLVGLLDDVAPQALGSLVPVPGATVGRAEPRDDRVQPAEGGRGGIAAA